MKNINLKILIIAIFLLSFSAFSQDSLAIESKCDSLKAAYEAHQVRFDYIRSEMKLLNNSKTEKESLIAKQKWDSLYIAHNNIWKLYEEAKVQHLKCIGEDNIKICYDPPPPPPPPHIIEEEILDTWKTRPILSEESKNKLYDYITLNYPAQALKESISGAVIIKFICNKEGIAERVSVTLEKPPNIGFGEVAVEAIKRVRFTPSLNSRGEPVKIRMDYKINFKPPKK